MENESYFNLDENVEKANELLRDLRQGNYNQKTQIEVALRLKRTTKHLEFWLNKYFERETEFNKSKTPSKT